MKVSPGRNFEEVLHSVVHIVVRRIKYNAWLLIHSSQLAKHSAKWVRM